MTHRDSEVVLAAQVVRILSMDARRCEILRSVESMGLADCWVGAGFVRNAVWDHLHGYAESTPLNDIDVAYYDASANLSQDRLVETRLNASNVTNARFSVKNQVHMNERNHHAPYHGTLDAISRWTECCTCVAARLTGKRLEVFAAFGWSDLFDMIIRPNETSSENCARVRARVSAKGWLQTWPKLRLATGSEDGGAR